MAKKKSKFKEKCKQLSGEFKKFVSKGNIIDMSVGVIIGSAFSAIVKSFTNILLSLATWGVPGGLTGLITVLPPTSFQAQGLNGLNHVYSKTGFEEMLATKTEAEATSIKGLFTTKGDITYWSKCAIIDWGTFINAIITFIIIALTLFVIVKVVKTIGKKRKELAAKMQEEYYKKHPDERPEVVVPVKPVTELDVLKDMNSLMHDQAKQNMMIRRKAPTSMRNR